MSEDFLTKLFNVLTKYQNHYLRKICLSIINKIIRIAPSLLTLFEENTKLLKSIFLMCLSKFSDLT